GIQPGKPVPTFCTGLSFYIFEIPDLAGFATYFRGTTPADWPVRFKRTWKSRPGYPEQSKPCTQMGVDIGPLALAARNVSQPRKSIRSGLVLRCRSGMSAFTAGLGGIVLQNYFQHAGA